MATKNPSRRALLLELSGSIKQVIATVGKSDGIMDVGSKDAAVAFFASKGTDIAQAKWQVSELRTEIIRSIADRIWSARYNNMSLGPLLHRALQRGS